LEPGKVEFTISVLALQVHDIQHKTMVQFHVMAQIDDTCHFDVGDLKLHPQIPFDLQARMCWSKNICEDRDVPNQIILVGAMDNRYFIRL
jgi:hypothetical protein